MEDRLDAIERAIMTQDRHLLKQDQHLLKQDQDLHTAKDQIIMKIQTIESNRVRFYLTKQPTICNINFYQLVVHRDS